MKNNKRLTTYLIFLLTLSPSAFAKQTVLNPVDGVGLHQIMLEISAYRTCMDDAQKTAKRGKNAYNTAQSQQCDHSYTALSQLMDKQSLKQIDQLSWQRWRKQSIGAGFTVERVLKHPTSLISGVKK